VAAIELAVQAWMVAGLGFVIALCLWWIYLDLAKPPWSAAELSAWSTCTATSPCGGRGAETGVRRSSTSASEWTSMRDCTFVGRMSLAVLALTLAAAGSRLRCGSPQL
jgi:hypothetical protein